MLRCHSASAGGASRARIPASDVHVPYATATLRGGEMKIVHESFKDLRALYVHQLRTLLSAEEQLVRSLPDMANMAHDEQLQDAFRSHLQETEVHVKRLEELLMHVKGVDRAV